MLIKSLEMAKRAIKIVFGFTFLFIGIALLVLPGPGIVIIIFGLIILATEYIWARNLLEKAKFGLNKLKIRKYR
ncbi:MAG: PGPGW domain-containing protein [Nanoarchaeota archaeon]|nr:PGPGW domain-containing protein [Nanoarchaeota archaeon]